MTAILDFQSEQFKLLLMTIILATLADLPFPMIYAKDSATRHPWFWRRRFLKVFSHTKAYGSKLDLAVKRSNVNVRPLF